MNHMKHMWICVALMIIAIVLVAAGAGTLAFLAPLACAGMMVMMVWMMVRGHGH